MKLEGKTAIVTGGGRDIGRAVAEKLASEGASTAINYFSSSKGADQAAETITAKGGRAIAVQRVLNNKVASTFPMTQACLAQMKSEAIVNLASQADRDGRGPGAVAYAASKGAVISLTRGLAKEVGPEINVNALCPGMIDMDFHNIHTLEAWRSGLRGKRPTQALWACS